MILCMYLCINIMLLKIDFLPYLCLAYVVHISSYTFASCVKTAP